MTARGAFKFLPSRPVHSVEPQPTQKPEPSWPQSHGEPSASALSLSLCGCSHPHLCRLFSHHVCYVGLFRFQRSFGQVNLGNWSICCRGESEGFALVLELPVKGDSVSIVFSFTWIFPVFCPPALPLTYSYIIIIIFLIHLPTSRLACTALTYLNRWAMHTNPPFEPRSRENTVAVPWKRLYFVKRMSLIEHELEQTYEQHSSHRLPVSFTINGDGWTDTDHHSVSWSWHWSHFVADVQKEDFVKLTLRNRS